MNFPASVGATRAARAASKARHVVNGRGALVPRPFTTCRALLAALAALVAPTEAGKFTHGSLLGFEKGEETSLTPERRQITLEQNVMSIYRSEKAKQLNSIGWYGMRIPRNRRLTQFVRETASQCLSSRVARANRGAFYQNYVDTGSADPATPAMYNKLFVSLDDLESLLFSPVSLRFHVGDPDLPNVVNEAKGRATAARIRNFYRRCDADSMLSQAVNAGLIKGKGLIKQGFANKHMVCWLVQPEDFGVLRENHPKLDESMGAFAHVMMITLSQFENLVEGRPDRSELMKKVRAYTRESAGGLTDTRGTAMNIVVGGLYPLQAAGRGPGNPTRGLVDWMGTPRPQLDPAVEQSLIELTEVWVWDDERDDWATFQIVGDDLLIMGKDTLQNAMAFDPSTLQSVPCLKGLHPYSTFCPNPVPTYFWGASEVQRLVYLQEAINARLTGTNKMLRF